MPAVLLCLGLCVGAIQVAAQHVRLVDGAAVAARLMGRGDDPSAVIASTGAHSHETYAVDDLICVRLSADHSVAVIGAIGISSAASACAVADDEGNGR